MEKRPKIMGILNVTPDSFSDGGNFLDLDKAIERALEMEAEGADIIDVGGESTGPGSEDIELEQELKRVIPVIKGLRDKSKINISVDTYKSEVANQALAAGANIINDVTALRGDEKMASTIAKQQAGLILMYAKDNSARTTIKNQEYEDVVQTVSRFLAERIAHAEEAGIKNIIIDPGMGHFVSSVPRYSYELIARLKELKTLDKEILIGISRKSLLGGKMENRDQRGFPLTAIAYLNGASIIRTHTVKQTLDFFKTINHE